MKFKFFSAFVFTSTLFVNCFKIPTHHQIVKINDDIYDKYEYLGKHKKWFEPNLFSTVHDFNHNSKDVLLDFSHKTGNEVVKLISAGLPHVDSIGHKILHANDIYINNILNNPNIPHELQKTLILTSIKLAQYGDDMGSNLLTLYYNLVDYCL
tara:strand:+ start:195 stop:653 length:459 start_codon:yes stop_codon:yes gene_type:complete